MALRIAYVLIFKRDDAPDGDAIYYAGQAQFIADGRWFTFDAPVAEAADHPPLTSLALSVVALGFPASVLAQRIGVAVVGAVVVVVIGVLGREIGGDRAGLIAAVIAAVYPNLWMNDALTMSETFVALLVAILLVVVYRTPSPLSTRRLAGLGALVGLLALTRSETALLFVLVVVPIAVGATYERWARRLGLMAIAAVAAAAIVAPWTIYNVTRFEKPVLLSSNDGLTLLGANCDDVYYGGDTALWDLGCILGLPVAGDQSEVSEAYRELAFDYIANHKRRLPVVMAARVGRVWSLYGPARMVEYNTGEGRETWASWLGLGAYYLLAPAAVVGAVVLRRRGVALAPLLATAALVTISAALFYGLVRFRVPAEVAIVVLAAVALDAGRPGLRSGAVVSPALPSGEHVRP